MIRNLKLAAAVSALALVSLAACAPPAAQKEEAPVAPAAEPAPPAAPALVDVVDTAVAAGQFTTLASALTAAGLVETLKGAGPFTVFAPNDEAFKKVDAATLAGLLKPEGKASLTEILTYHVVPNAKVMSADLAGKKQDVDTALAGKKLTVDATTAGTVKVGGATVIQADIEASNGVIHVVDAVIMPPKK